MWTCAARSTATATASKAACASSATSNRFDSIDHRNPGGNTGVFLLSIGLALTAGRRERPGGEASDTGTRYGWFPAHRPLQAACPAAFRSKVESLDPFAWTR